MTIENFSRRDLLKTAAGLSGLVLGFHVGLRPFSFASAATLETFSPNVYLSIDENGDVTIVAHRSEMGTGIRTGLPMVLADELEADWSRVKVVQAQGDPKYGDQNTDGSRSVRQFYQPMRVAGATARQMLETAAARIWNAPVQECRAQNHAVVHSPTGRRLGFGDAREALLRRCRSPLSSDASLQGSEDTGATSASLFRLSTSKTSSAARRSSASTLSCPA